MGGDATINEEAKWSMTTTKQQVKKLDRITPVAPPDPQMQESPVPQGSSNAEPAKQPIDYNTIIGLWWEALRSKEEALKQFIPMSRSDLAAFLRHLTRRKRPTCDHTLRDTLAFLHKRKLDVDPIVKWLKERGGFCDCELRMNVLPWVEEYLALVEEGDSPTSHKAHPKSRR